MSVRTPIEDETKIHENIGKMAPTDHILSEYLRQQKPEKEEEQWKHGSTGANTVCTTGR